MLSMNDKEERGKVPLDVPAGKAIADKDIVECEGDKRWEFPLDYRFARRERSRARSSLSVQRFNPHQLVRTGVEAPEQLRLSCREKRPTAVGGCRYADGSLKKRGSISLQVIVRVKSDK